jgi:predicted HAD superfamily Cof-like phosphohydrolase
MCEEVFETCLAIDEEDLDKTIDGCLDTLVVTYGTLEAVGFDAEPGFDEVQRSNMSKVNPLVVREDGKILKGPNYSPPNLGPIIEAQIKAGRV